MSGHENKFSQSNDVWHTYATLTKIWHQRTQTDIFFIMKHLKPWNIKKDWKQSTWPVNNIGQKGHFIARTLTAHVQSGFDHGHLGVLTTKSPRAKKYFLPRRNKKHSSYLFVTCRTIVNLVYMSITFYGSQHFESIFATLLWQKNTTCWNETNVMMERQMRTETGQQSSNNSIDLPLQ